MRINDETIRPLDPCIQGANAGGGKPGPAIRTVHVKPNPELGADIRDRVEVVNEAFVGGSRRGNNRENSRIICENPSKGGSGEVITVIHGHRDDVDIQSLGG